MSLPRHRLPGGPPPEPQAFPGMGGVPPTEEEKNRAAKVMSQALVGLLLDHPYYGGLAMQLKLEVIDQGTMATNGVTIFYSPKFVLAITFEEVQGVLVHEVCHVTYLHHLRIGTRQHMPWNYAADAVINPIVMEEAGIRLPTGGVLVPEWANLSAEQAYSRIPVLEIPEGGSGEGEGDDDGQGQGMSPPSWGEVLPLKKEDGSDMTPAETKIAEEEVKQKIIGAAERAKSIGKLPAAIEGYVEGLIKPKVDLYSRLAKAIAGENPDQWSWAKPNRRFVVSGDIFPSQEKTGVGNILLSIDTSGSVSDKEIKQYTGMVSAILEDYSPERVVVVRHTSYLTGWEELEPGEAINGMRHEDRGGTRIAPVFAWIKENQFPVTTMIALTDLEINDFPEEPDFPVLWVTTGATNAPFGEVVKLEE